MPDSLIPEKPDVLSPALPSPSPSPSPIAEPEMREFGDARATRKNIYDQVLGAASALKPMTSPTHTLKLTNVRYVDPEKFTKREQKHAILTGDTLGRRLKGTWNLHDATGNVIDTSDQVIARVPYLTGMGLFIDKGSQYTLNNQQRLRSGIFHREKENDDIEAHVNVMPGKGLSHRYFLEPKGGVFKMKVHQAELPLMPLLRAMGTTDREFVDAWGDKLYAANYQADDASALKKLQTKLLPHADQADDNQDSVRTKLVNVLANMQLDPDVTKHTLGQPFGGITKDAILASTKKLLAISRGEAQVDDRDNLAYQNFLGPEDLLRERIERDHGRHQAAMFRKVAFAGNLKRMPSGLLTPQIRQALLSSGLGQAIEEINPAEVLDKQGRITRMGEGGIPSLDAIPDEARGVQPSHLNFMDPLRTPESFRVGVDVNMARAARKGKDGKIYSQFRDNKSGQTVWRTPQELADASIATPDVMNWDTKRVPVTKGGRTVYVPKNEVDYVVPHYENAFSPLGNLVPIKSGVKGQRVAMASRMLTQALPLTNAEAPLVRGAVPGAEHTSFEEEYGRHMGAVRADAGGRVLGVKDGVMQVQYDDGKKDEIDLYEHYPFNRKTFLHQTPVVQAGQTFAKGTLLARSNYTDAHGVTALGTNLRSVYIPWRGRNFEDSLAISESAAKDKLNSEHMYYHDVEVTPHHKVGRNAFVSLFPQKFDKKTLQKIDHRGTIQPGQMVEYGEPLILAARERDTAQNKIHKKRQAGYLDESVVWTHHDPGLVTDVVWGKSGPVVTVKSIAPMQIGDKLSGRYGDKGVVAAIIPDHQMPHDADGKPYEIILNSLGVTSRTNPAQKIEAWLGKIARKTGKPINVPDFDKIEDLTEWTHQQLRRHGLSSTTTIFDPTRNRKIKNVAEGHRFFMKLHHTAESKGQARGEGGYTADETPSKGGPDGSKRISMLDVNAMLSHGAVENLRDVGAVRGQKDEEKLLQFMQGYTPREPKVPFVYQKFVNHLKGAGINVVQDGDQLHVMALKRGDVDELAGDRELRNADTVNFDRDLKPVAGGLFDPQLTGGHGGNKWSAIRLNEPLPNPVMEEPIRRILGLTQKEYERVISGEHELPSYGSGPKAIAQALDAINLPRALSQARVEVQSTKGTTRDMANRRLGYLKSAQERGLHPRDWVLDRVPVLPPMFRPVSMMSNGQPLVSDPNYLYKELMTANKNLEEMKNEVGDDVGHERLAAYHAFKAVTGLSDPVHPKLQEKNVKGILKSIFGNSPKFGTVQRKLLSSAVDNVGRAVIIPNPDYDMDTVGIPEDKAFDVYGKFLVRKLRRQGLPVSEALRHVKDRSGLARDMLVKEMDERPVFINRAPVLHRFGIMAFKPRLVKGDVMQVSPLIVKGFNADFDGDAMQFHVPTGHEAVKEAYERMLPSRNLISPADFKTPVHIPTQEYIGGLWYASKQKSKGRPRYFDSLESARKAWAAGQIGVADEVVLPD